VNVETQSEEARMHQIRMAAVIGTVLLLLTTGEARAECAWVLWGNLSHWDTHPSPVLRDKGGWDVLEAFATRADCIAGMRKAARIWDGPGTKVTVDIGSGSFSTVTVINNGNGQVLGSAKCLP